MLRVVMVSTVVTPGDGERSDQVRVSFTQQTD